MPRHPMNTAHLSLMALIRKWMVLMGCLMGTAVTWGDNSEVVVLFNRRVPQSLEVAQYYAGKRQVPTNQILGFEFQDQAYITRQDYVTFAEDFLIKELEKRGLARFRKEIVPTMATHTHLRGIAGVASAEERKALKLGAAESVKRVKLHAAEDRIDWFSDRAQGLYELRDFLEFKTTWHPIGA